MDVKTKVATEIALKAFDKIKSCKKWDDLIGSETDWKEVEKFIPNYDLDEMIKKLDIDQTPLNQLIDELNEKIDQAIEEFKQTEICS